MEHLYKIGLEHFRLFEDKIVFDLSPITLLTGINNSGKSSLIKSLLLLKASFENSSNLSELLFTEGKHHLGTFKNTISHNTNRNFITFTLKLPLNCLKESIFIDLMYIPKYKFNENGILKSFKIYSKDETIIEFHDYVDINEITEKEDIINDLAHSCIKTSKINLEYIVLLLKEIKKEQIPSNKINPGVEINLEEIFSTEYQNNAHAQYSSDIIEFNSIFNSFFKKKYDILEQISELNYDTPIFLLKNKESKEIVNNSEFIDIHSKIISYLKDKGLPPFCEDTYSAYNPDNTFDWFFDIVPNYLPNYSINNDKIEFVLSDVGKLIFQTIFKEQIKKSICDLEKIFAKIYTLSSTRAHTERLYNNVSDIDDFNRIIIRYIELDISGDIQEFIFNSLKLFKIGNSIKIERRQGVASEIFIQRDNDFKLLADLGFGYTQLLPIILKIAIIAKENEIIEDNHPSIYTPSILLLEEPESNLHPSFQSKLADLIIDAAKNFNIQFIIETHSEYLIRKLQYITAKQIIKSEDSVIYYFNSLENKNSADLVKKINILPDGRLSDKFGSGFFDETPRLMMSLLSDEIIN